MKHNLCVLIMCIVCVAFFIQGCGFVKNDDVDESNITAFTSETTASDPILSETVTETSEADSELSNIKDLTEEQAELIEIIPIRSINYSIVGYSNTDSGYTLSEDTRYPFADKTAEKNMTVNMFGKELTADYTESIKELNGTTSDFYVCFENDLKYSFTIRREDREVIGFMLPNKTDLKGFKNEEDLLTFVSDYQPDTLDRSEYTPFIVTSYTVNTGDSASRINNNGFIAASDEYKAVQYHVVFIKLYKGIPTNDQISVIINDDMVISRMSGDKHTPDYYEKAAALALQDEEIVRDFIVSKLDGKAELLSIENISNVLTNVDGKASVVATVSFNARALNTAQTDEDGKEPYYTELISITITLDD